MLFLLGVKPTVGCKRESEGSSHLEAEIHRALKSDDEQPEDCRKLIIYKLEPNSDMSNDVIITEALAGTLYCLTGSLFSTGCDITSQNTIRFKVGRCPETMGTKKIENLFPKFQGCH